MWTNHYRKTLPDGRFGPRGEVKGLPLSEILFSVAYDGSKKVEEIIGHLSSNAHNEQVVAIEAMNSLFGRTKMGYGDRHLQIGNFAREVNSIMAFGKQFLFRATNLIPVPCVQAVRDFVGADFECASIFVLHQIREGKLVVSVDDKTHFRLALGDVGFVSPCLISWSETDDGASASTGRYTGENTTIVDVAFLP